ncbi:hypothetical protein ACLX1H_006505 [Fusarium chlamydosporum]
MLPKSALLLTLALAGSSFADDYKQWGVYVYSDKYCDKQIGQWRDEQAADCISIDGMPDGQGIKMDVDKLGPFNCGWVVYIYENADCSGESLDAKYNQYY